MTYNFLSATPKGAPTREEPEPNRQLVLPILTITLGHVQRGGTPVAADLVLATEFGNKAIELPMAGERARLVVMKGRTVTDTPLEDAEGKQRLIPLDHPLIRAARNVGTCFGD